MSKSKKNKVRNVSNNQPLQMKKENLKEKSIKGVTSSGFSFEITEDRLANYELVEVIAEVDTNPLILPKVVNLILGNQAESLKNHVRTEDGIVPLDKMGDEIREIFESQKQVKN